MSTKGKKGVIFFSTGTIMRTTDMGENFRRNVLLTFSQLTDYHFIVKIENDDNVNFGSKRGQNTPNKNIVQKMVPIYKTSE